MKTSRMMGVVVLLGLWILPLCGLAQEEEGPTRVILPEETEFDSTELPEEEEAAKEPSPEEPGDETEQEEEGDIFSWFSLAPEVGYLFFPKSELTVKGFKATVEPRNGFIMKLHLDLGGDGLAFELAPLFSIQGGGITPDGGGFWEGIDIGSGGNFQSVGGQMALVYRFKLGHFFPHLGLSFHGSYLMGDEIDFGTEIYARIPIGFTVYMGKSLGLVVDVGLMYGVTGIKTPIVMPDEEIFQDMPGMEELENAKTTQEIEAWATAHEDDLEQWFEENRDELPENYTHEQITQDFVSDQIGKSVRYGQGFGIDIMVGLRFP